MLATLRQNSYFGELALFSNKPRNASIRAATFCDLNVLHRDDLMRLLDQHPAVAKNMQDVVKVLAQHRAATVT